MALAELEGHQVVQLDSRRDLAAPRGNSIKCHADSAMRLALDVHEEIHTLRLPLNIDVPSWRTGFES